MNESFAVILAGPSGAGKTTLRDKLLESDGGDRFQFSVSMTTRGARVREEDGVDYHFVDAETFDALVEDGGMLEHAIVHGLRYGTPARNLADARLSGRHLLLDIDVQGARQVREAVPDVLSIFVLPPSEDEMIRRLAGRGTEKADELNRRYRSALEELEAVDEFDHVVVNDDLDQAIAEVRTILEAERRGERVDRDRAPELVERLKGEIARRMQ